MCTKTNLKASLLLISATNGALALGTFITGLIIVFELNIQRAFGEDIEMFGGLLIGISFTMAAMTVMGEHGARDHNKFCLLIFIMVAVIFACCQVEIGKLLISRSTAEFSEAFRADCSQLEPVHTEEECDEYLKSERIAGVNRMWRAYWELGVIAEEPDTGFEGILLDIQSSGVCCGFHPPLHCEENEEAYPPNLLMDIELTYYEERQQCGRKKKWYPATPACDQIVDENALRPKTGGCRYDFPVGGCLNAFPQPITKGCVFAAEEWVAAKARTLGIVVISLTCCEFMGIVAAVCLFFKRKDEDMLPYKVQPKDPEADILAEKNKSAMVTKK